MRLKGEESGSIDLRHEPLEFMVDTVCAVSEASEQFAIGVTIRMNEEPMRLVTERLIEHEHLSSAEQGQLFKYEAGSKSCTLKDFQGQKF